MNDVSSVDELKKKIADLEKTVSLLKDGNERLLRLIETVPEGIMIIDAGGKITFVNSTLEKIYSIGRSEIIGSNCNDPRWCFQMPGLRKNGNDELIFDFIVKTGQAVINKEHLIEINADNTKVCSINAAPYFDETGKIAGVVAAITDITDRNRLSSESIEIREIYERLTHYADEAIFRTRASDGKIIYTNDAAERILGYSQKDYLGGKRSFYTKLIIPEYFPAYLKSLEEMKNGIEVVKNIVLGLMAKDGRTVIMEFTAIAVRDQKGNITYYESLGRDITSRRFMEQELAKAQKLESIGLLAGGIAHDFNNILTAILGSLSLAKMEANPANALYDRLAGAEEQCIKAKSLTRRLLSYSRGGSPLRITASIAQVLREAVDFALSGKNIECKFDLADNLWPAQIDEGQMHQVIHYLVANAADAMPDGGTIDIGARNVSLDTDEVPSLSAGNYIQWYVRDHGVGIPKEHMKKLFDPYFTTKEMGSMKGVGLGLAICYSIIKNHEGLISVESKQQVGTTFTIYIPAVIEEENEKKANIKPTTQTKRKHKVLLIDDEKILLDVTGSMLAHLGYEVATAQNHTDALTLYGIAKNKCEPFSLIIMDLTMRGDEGGEKAIRKWLSLYPEVKAIISSGYINDPVIEEYWKHGFAAAILKPYTLDDLKQTLENIVAKNNN
jgi:PAS domain S-box-containing protein